MAKKMKFERKQARQQRSEPYMMPAPVEKSNVDEPKPAAKPKPQQDPLKQIVSYVQSLDWGRVRATANKAISSGLMTEDEVDKTIDASLPSAESLQSMPMHHVMAIASAATPEKRAEYMPILQMHAEHAKNLPPEEHGQIKDHLQVLGMLPEQESV